MYVLEGEVQEKRMGAVGFAANEVDGRVTDQVNGIGVVGREHWL